MSAARGSSPAPWFWLEFEGSPDRLEALLAELLDTDPSGSLESGDQATGAIRLRVWWPADRGAEEILMRAERACPATGARLVDRGSQPREDWLAEWRRHRRPFRATERFLVCPPERVPADPEGAEVLVLDQRMAFGSGQHETTRLCLELLEEHVLPGDRVLDVGAGSGILSIAAVRLGAASVLAVERDPDVLEEIERNLEANGADGTVQIAARDLADLPESLGTQQLVVANLILGRLVPLLPALAAASRGRVLLISGIEEEQGPEAQTRIEAAGLTVELVRRKGEWLAFVCRCCRAEGPDS